jgi:predicted DNA-binding transcriptional regulator
MDDRVTGYLILIGSIVGIGVYFWLVFLAPQAWAWLTIQASAMVAVGGILLIVAWIGYTLATTPPPVPLEDMDLDDFDIDDEFDEDFDFDDETEEETEEEEE